MEDEKLTIEEETSEETPVEATAEETKKPKVKIVITKKAFLKALELAGGEAKITPLYEAFDRTAYLDVAPATLKTALRAFGKELAEKGKVQAVHVDEKRTYTFKTV